ncbi:MAG TPA: exonuclease subunit SbcD [Bacteroidales bacterium]|nr:exonuclease subunit SbcD [Bacteroidales bacterium]
MKILHTSDWHLGKKLEGFSRLEEQETALSEICEIADHENVDAVIVAGDLFDTFNPPSDAVEVFYRYLKKLANNGNRAVVAIAGNHDSPERIEAPDPLARECGIIFSGFPGNEIAPFRLETGLELSRSAPGFLEMSIPGTGCPLRIITVPYANEIRLRTYLGTEEPDAELRMLLEYQWAKTAETFCDSKGVNVLAAHLLFARDDQSIPEEPEEERRINYIGGAPAIFTGNLPSGIHYVASGHLHRFQLITSRPCPVVYSGSPLAYSFNEADQDKHVVIVEAEPGQMATYRKHLLKSGLRLIRKRFEDMDEAVEWLTQNQDVYLELTIVSDQYLSAIDRKRLQDAHPHIVTIIPESRNAIAGDDGNKGVAIDLTKKMEELFIDYFKYKKRQEPGENILDLFREITSGKEEE